MTVAELIAALADYPPEMIVFTTETWRGEREVATLSIREDAWVGVRRGPALMVN